MKSFLLALLLAPVALAADVSGYVYTLDGAPVEGATVRAGNVTVTTNKDGAFALGNLAEGVVELEVAKEGLPKARPLVLAGDVVSITLTELDPGPSPVPGQPGGPGTVSGKITVDGKPLANAPVFAGGMRALTNAKGEYVARGLAAARHAVTVDERLFPRLRSPHSTRMYVEGAEPYIADLRKTREAVVDLDLHAAPMIRGHVVDAEGKPVPRARVQLVIANRSTLDFAFDLTAVRTTPEGRFALPAPEWSDDEQASVAVTPLLQSTIRSKPFALAGAKADLEIRLPKLETVRIRVLDRAGKAIPDARVAFAASADTVTFDSAELLLQEQFAKNAPRTNAGGELVVQLAADTYDFTAAAEGFQIGTVTSKAIAKPMTVDVTLQRAATLRGRLHRGDRGVAGVSVSVVGERMRERNTFTSTDADGRFELTGLAPGSYRVQLSKQEELIDRELSVQVPGDVVDVALPPTGTLRGRVVDSATSLPVREIVYSVEPADPEPQSRSSGGVHRGEATADGTFSAELPAGTYRVNAVAPGYTASSPAEVRVVEDETTTVELPLGRGAVVRGRVTDEQGAPIAGADVMILDADFARVRAQRTTHVGPATAETAEDGSFTVSGVEPGDAQLSVRKQGYVAIRKAIQADGETSVDVQLSRGLSLSGIVTRGGKPVAGATVGASTPAVGGEHQPAVTDDDGRFTLTGLVAGRYTVSAFFEESHADVRDVDPSRQKDVAISLDPQAKGTVYGTVTGIPPSPGRGGKYVRRVVMVNSEDGSAEGPIDEAGSYRIEYAPTGSVYVTALIESSAGIARSSSRKQVEVIVGQPLRVDLELGGNVRVSGRITIDGKPVAGATVGFMSEDGMMGSAQSRDDGMYEMFLPAPGRYHVYARSDELNERHYQAVRDIRGGETIDIDLHEQVLEGTVVDAVTRRPIAGALVTLTPAAGALMSIAAEVPSDANGRFRIATAAAGATRLIASAAGYAIRTLPVTGTTSQYTFELTPAPDLRVRVLDARTNAPLEAHVIVSDADGFIDGRPRRSADGATYLFSLAPGQYRVMAIVQGYAAKTVEVTAPGEVDIEVQ